MQEIFLFICVLGLAKHSVCEIYTPIFFNEEEVRHVREVPKEKPPCKEAALVKILADCQVISPESIVDIAITDFDSACKIVSTQTRRVEKLYKNCTASGLYMYLINGLLSFDEKLCKSNEFYNEYDRYDKCITDLDNDFDSCNGVADWNEDEDSERLCKSYKDILDCYYIKTAKVCGLNAASTLKELMTDIMDCTIKEKCSVSSNPAVRKPMPEKYIDIINKATSKTSLHLIFICINEFLIFLHFKY